MASNLSNKSATGHWLWHLSSPFQWALVDAAIAFGCMYAGYHLSPSAKDVARYETHLRWSYSAGLFAGISFLVSYILGLSHYPNLHSRFRIAVLTLVLALASLSGTLVITSLILYKQIGRFILIIATCLYFVLEASIRLSWYSLLTESTHRVAIWSDSGLSNILEELLRSSALPIEVIYIGVPQEATLSTLASAINTCLPHEIVIHGNEQLPPELLISALDRGIAVSTMDAFAEKHFLSIPVSFIDASWFFRIDLKQHHPFYEPSKRILDIALSILIGIIAAPIIIASAVLIKADSRGPIFYSQSRIGLRQRPFRIWKLRTMREHSEPAGARWASKVDPRVTRVGRLLRRMRIDELPQLWNILKGEMALVGPRPERPEFVTVLEQEIPFYRQRHLIKPGLTGWAQICFPYGATVADSRAKLSYDLYYLKNVSFLLDLQIVLQTIGAVAKGSR